ncbi:MAG: hypothetical protein A2W00_11950 [Candidatus Eisenbacteria bacterium RBG_16_71_46]|nr:MAG: hypothetical protein A2W00_11950 [Candidatus Eisenbacteria bacterium RBG_16_71_46]
MKPLAVLRAAATSALLAAAAASPAAAVVPVAFGTTWDAPSTSLQKIVDGLYGAGAIDVQHDYIGARAGDLDPWFWVDDHFSALLIREVAGNANRNLVGWYLETGTRPAIDGVDDGVVFDGPQGAGATAIIVFPRAMTAFGFYMNPNGPLAATNAPEPELFYSNRLYNDRGPDGAGALHAPTDGDVQALVFDVSRFDGPNTWLVCFEDLDSGANPGPPGHAQTDNDFNDFVFEVTAFGATPALPMSFGGLKQLYRK